MILGNARLGDRIVDLRIEDGRIAEIGAIGTGDVDLAGRWVIPGLWDEHVHFTQWALTSQRVDLSTAASAAEAAAIVGAAGGEGLVIGAGFRDGLWPDAPGVELLDAATGALPAVLVSADLHSVWLNSAALEVYGHRGHPTGLLVEGDAFDVERRLGSVPVETVDGWARAAAAAAARRGVVGIVDLEMAWNLDEWLRRIAAGHDDLRVEFGVYTDHLERAIAEGLRTGRRIDALLTMGRFKVLTDGSLNTRTAYIHGDYDDGSHGMLTVPPERLVPLMRTASAAGIDPTVHAIGDHANTLALDAFQRVGCPGRIEHAQLLSRADLPRFAELGVEVSVQPEHLLDDRDVAERYWPGATDRAYPFRSLLDAGARLRFGSDAPVSPLDPWLGIAAAVGRSRGGRQPWHPEQRITNAEALAASARTRVAVGEPADLAVTERDPIAADAEALRTMPVAATMLGGRFTHTTL
ncbi:amidohydrolase family protein [Leifsonia sp. H3M29-4]|uniref:amidohydrolase n=1 Tax=Salinibacterium metalliresistens TaxID=3031321 RepID=UPI0023DB7543|nr:amidohydrolase family protein [Salinibacterium metalliresistens]MDF1478625.1 amidohydrolase family protein [Salinibacterium metalliresistens]